jgi:hypothetical protein
MKDSVRRAELTKNDIHTEIAETTEENKSALGLSKYISVCSVVNKTFFFRPSSSALVRRHR